MKYSLLLISLILVVGCKQNANPSLNIIRRDSATKTISVDSAKKVDPWAKVMSYMDKMSRCEQLRDSQRGLLIMVYQGKATQKQYEKGFYIYRKYYNSVYKPALDSLNK